MPKIYFRGNMPPMEVGIAEADMADLAIREGRSGAIIELGNLSVRASEIKAIVREPEGKNTIFSDQMREWAKEREDFYKKSADEKVQAAMNSFVKLISKILQYNFLDIEASLAEFYRENRYRVMPDMSFFTGRLPQDHATGKKIDAFSNRMLTHLSVQAQVDRE